MAKVNKCKDFTPAVKRVIELEAERDAFEEMAKHHCRIALDNAKEMGLLQAEVERLQKENDEFRSLQVDKNFEQELETLKKAAKSVTWFDFCDDDDDVQLAVDRLRKLLKEETPA